MSGTAASSGDTDPASPTDGTAPSREPIIITGTRPEQATTDSLAIKPFSNVTITNPVVDATSDATTLGSTTTFQAHDEIQIYTAPVRGIYDTGGLGADVSGHVTLAAGEMLRIAVGDTDEGGPSSGGGGSFVVAPGNLPLIIAGGGGGGSGIDDGGHTNYLNGGDGGPITSSGGGGGSTDGEYSSGGGGVFYRTGQAEQRAVRPSSTVPKVVSTIQDTMGATAVSAAAVRPRLVGPAAAAAAATAAGMAVAPAPGAAGRRSPLARTSNSAWRPNLGPGL
jgi:hypothetical protein